MVFYMTLVGTLFALMSLSLFDYSEEANGWSNLFFIGMFLAGLLCLCALPYVAFMKRKVLIFTRTATQLKMSDPLAPEDKDFNKSVLSTKVKKLYRRENLKLGGFGEIVDGLFYSGPKGKDLLFLDLTLPEVKIDEKSIQEIIQFVND